MPLAELVAIFLSTNTLEVTALTNDDDGTAIITGTLTADIVVKGDTTPLTGSAISLAYVSGTTSTWRGQFPSTVPLAVSGRYVVRLTYTGAAGDRYWEPDLIVRKDRG